MNIRLVIITVLLLTDSKSAIAQKSLDFLSKVEVVVYLENGEKVYGTGTMSFQKDVLIFKETGRSETQRLMHDDVEKVVETKGTMEFDNANTFAFAKLKNDKYRLKKLLYDGATKVYVTEYNSPNLGNNQMKNRSSIDYYIHFECDNYAIKLRKGKAAIRETLLTTFPKCEELHAEIRTKKFNREGFLKIAYYGLYDLEAISEWTDENCDCD